MPRYQVIRRRVVRVVEEGRIEIDASSQEAAETIVEDMDDGDFSYVTEDRETQDSRDTITLIPGAPTDEEAGNV